jgi:hypothetical protein
MRQVLAPDCPDKPWTLGDIVHHSKFDPQMAGKAMSAGHDPVAAAVHVRFRAESDRCYRSATVTLVLTELAMKQFS